MEQKKPEVQSRSVISLHITPRARRVPPLTDEEIIKLRQLLIDAELVFSGCTMAKRALSKR